MKKILHIVGNRPHFIKLAMLYAGLSTDDTIIQEIVHSGQHSSEEMSGVFFKELGIPQPHHYLKIDNSQGSDIFIANTSTALQQLFQHQRNSIVFTYGDTNTTLAAAIAAKRTGIPLHHFEAGIRTGNYTMPEEINRVITDRLANVNYSCTQFNYDTLLSEGHTKSIDNKIFLTGDLMYDAYLKTKPAEIIIEEKEYIACTIHRAENITNKKNLTEIVEALNTIHKEIPVLLALHPHTKKRMEEFNIQPRFKTLPPLGYRQMKTFLQNCIYIITDSGGVSREAYFSSKKSLIISPALFWPEIGMENCALNALPQKHLIAEGFQALPNLQSNFNNNIFGDGNAAEKIHAVLKQEAAL